MVFFNSKFRSYSANARREREMKESGQQVCVCETFSLVMRFHSLTSFVFFLKIAKDEKPEKEEKDKAEEKTTQLPPIQ